MTAKHLFLAIGDVDSELVFAQPPKKQSRAIYGWLIAAAAAAAVAAIGYVGLTQWQQQPPPTTDPTPPTVTTTQPPPTGGDENACTEHDFLYHTISGNLPGMVGKEGMDEFIALYEGEESNVVNFVKHFGITREQFIAAQNWEGCLSQQFGEYDLFTIGMYVDAIYGDDAVLSEWVFTYRPHDSNDTPPCDVFLTEEECTAHQPEYHRINEELIRLVGGKRWRRYLNDYGGRGEGANILTFIAYCGITREQYVMTMGWQDNLDSPAVDHGNVDYTYGEFVDAIYGDDPYLTQRIFAAP